MIEKYIVNLLGIILDNQESLFLTIIKLMQFFLAAPKPQVNRGDGQQRVHRVCFVIINIYKK